MFFLLIFLLGGVTFMKLFRRVQNIQRQFNGGDAQQKRKRHDYSGEGIYDPRAHAERNKKIIPKDEGEYVEYEEEK